VNDQHREPVASMATTAEHEPHMTTAAEPDTIGEDPTTTPDAGTGTDLTPLPAPTRSAVQVTTVVAVSVVAAVAAVVSFMHMYELAARAGEGWRAWLVPLAIDGLVVAASMTMVVRRRAGKKTGWLAWISVTLGIAASLAANIAAAEPTLIGRAVAAWPPIALLLAYELLMDQIHIATKHVDTQRFTHPPVPSPIPAITVPPHEPSAAHNFAAVPTTTAPATTTPLTAPGPDGTAPQAGTPNSSPETAIVNTAAPSPVLIPVPDREGNSGESIRQAARHRYLKTLTDGLPCTGRELADMYGMSERWGRYQIRAAQRTLTTTHAANDTLGSLSGAHDPSGHIIR
jgi:hypothetical protein